MWVLLSMWIESPLPLPASTFAIFRFCRMTLLTPLSLNPHPVRPEPDPTPTIVLLDATVTSAEQVKLPLTVMTAAPLAFAALVSADRLVTVVLDPPAPPVVVPPTVA